MLRGHHAGIIMRGTGEAVRLVHDQKMNSSLES